MKPDDPRTFVHQTAEFVVRPYEVPCPRCAAAAWKLCNVLAYARKLAPRAHPQRIAAAQRITRYHVYELSKGRLLRTFADYPNAERFATAKTTMDLQEDVDAGTVIAIGVGKSPPAIGSVEELTRGEAFMVHRFHPEVRS